MNGDGIQLHAREQGRRKRAWVSQRRRMKNWDKAAEGRRSLYQLFAEGEFAVFFGNSGPFSYISTSDLWVCSSTLYLTNGGCPARESRNLSEGDSSPYFVTQLAGDYKGSKVAQCACNLWGSLLLGSRLVICSN